MGYTGVLIERAMMDDVGSILLLLRHHRHLFPPLFLPSTLRGSSILMLNHVLGYSWHFGSRGRPCTIYGSAYRTFSATYAHTCPLPSSFPPRLIALLREFVYAGHRARIRDERERGIARPKEFREPKSRRVQVRFSRITIVVGRWNSSRDKKLSARRSPAIIPAPLPKKRPRFMDDDEP